MPDSLPTDPTRRQPPAPLTPALDTPLHITVFADFAAQRKAEHVTSLRAIVPYLRDQRAATKALLPWLKLATFGEERSPRNSLRHDANLLTIHGIEGDYDGELITVDRARRIVEGANVAAIIYTSPSHTPERPRWRILCPASRPLPPSTRLPLIERLNGLFVGALSPESYTLSQSYYWGALHGAEHHTVEEIEGRFIDLADDLEVTRIKQPEPKIARPAATRIGSYTGDGSPYGRSALERECANIRNASDGNKHHALNKAAYSIGGLVAGGDLPEGPAWAELAAALSDIRDRCADYQHAQRTLRQAFYDGKGRPRSTPELPPIVTTVTVEAEPERASPFGIPEDFDPESGEVPGHKPAASASPLWVDADAWDAQAIPPRPWAVPGYLMRGSVSVLTGQGAGGKSSLVVAWTIACATGEALGNFAPRRAMTAINYNVEDDREEQRRRYSAALMAAGQAGAEVMPRIVRCGPHDVGTLFERQADTGRIVETKAMETLERLIQERGAEVLICDPLAELHNAEENDNTAMRSVVAAFRSLARRHNIAVLILHHNRKGSSTPGDMDQMRGASAISGAVRVVLTLAPMTAEEADKLGVQPDMRRRHFRVDGAKSNYAIAGEAEWWKLSAYPIGNSEEIAAARPWEPPSSFGDLPMSVCVDVLAKMHRGTTAGHAFASKKQAGADWAGRLLTIEPIGKTDGQAGSILDAWKASGLITECALEGPRRGHPRMAYAVDIEAVAEMRRQIREGIAE